VDLEVDEALPSLAKRPVRGFSFLPQEEFSIFPEPDFAHAAADPFPDPEPSVVVEDDSDDYGPFKQTSSSPLNQSNVGVSSSRPQSPSTNSCSFPSGSAVFRCGWTQPPSDVGVMGGTYSDAGGAARSDVGVYSNVGAKSHVAIASDVGVASDGGVNSYLGQVPTDIIWEN
jgi:hypothetical protein